MRRSVVADGRASVFILPAVGAAPPQTLSITPRSMSFRILVRSGSVQASLWNSRGRIAP
jgi:hypothetical protein